MADSGRPRALAYTGDFDVWAGSLPDGHFDAIDRHMRAKTINPKVSISAEPGDERFFSTFVFVDDHQHRARYRIDYEVTELAVIVLSGKRIPRRT
jgi:hypothetical protein